MPIALQIAERKKEKFIMKPTKPLFSMLLAVFLIAGFTYSSLAEVETVKIEMFGFVTNEDARQIRRLLEPWAKPQDVKFYPAKDKKGRERPFAMVVEIIPRRDNKYRESHTLDIYRIMRQLKDNRFRGRQSSGANGRSRVLKTEATVSGNLFAHPGWSRSYIRNVPFWRRWRADTSAVNHAMIARGWDEKIVFADSDEFDDLRREAGQDGRRVKVRGTIVGFDGPYPIMSVRDHRLEYVIEPKEKKDEGEKEPQSGKEAQKKPTYDYLKKSPKDKK
jgi:hypothetical protein